MRLWPTREGIRRRGARLLVVGFVALIYLWSGRIGGGTPLAYVTALNARASQWPGGPRFACVVPKLFEVGGWQRTWPLSEGLEVALQEAGWEMYRDTLPADTSTVLWRLGPVGPANLKQRLSASRFEAFGSYLRRFLPGSYSAVPVSRTRHLGGVTSGTPEVGAASWHYLEVVRCFAGSCESMGGMETLHADGILKDPEGYYAGKVGRCTGRVPVGSGSSRASEPVGAPT